MGVHVPRRRLAQLPQVPHQQHRAEPQPRRVVNGLPQVIAAQAPAVQPQAQYILAKSLAVIPRCNQYVLRPGGPQGVELQLDRVHQCRLAHGADNAAGAQNGDSPHNAQPGVEGLCGQRLPAGNRHHRPQAPGPVRRRQGFAQLFADHPPGGGVDGRLPHRLVQAGAGHPAHPLAAVDFNPSRDRQPLHTDQYEGSVGYVRVVSPVLLHRAGCPARPGGVVQELRVNRDARRGLELHGGQNLPPEQQSRRARRRRRRTGPRGVPAPQALPAHVDIFLQPCRIRSLPSKQKRTLPNM